MRARLLIQPILVLSILPGCDRDAEPTAGLPDASISGERVGILLVSHGSRSRRWREMLLDVEASVRDDLLSSPEVDGVRSAFMEYEEPSIATQLEAFDAEAYSRVVIVPLLLTVSSHSFDDIPTIYGAKNDAVSLELLETEGIRRYIPRCNVSMTPLLDFAALLEKNVLRRARGMSENPSSEGVVLVGYGSQAYDEEWTELFSTLSQRLDQHLGIDSCAHSWCGHIVNYDPNETTRAVDQVLAEKERALVIPVLVAFDEMFQGRIISSAIADASDSSRVRYLADSILPDPDLNDWVIQVSLETVRSFADAGS